MTVSIRLEIAQPGAMMHTLIIFYLTKEHKAMKTLENTNESAAMLQRQQDEINRLKAINFDLTAALFHIATLQRSDAKTWELLFYMAKDLSHSAYLQAKGEA